MRAALTLAAGGLTLAGALVAARRLRGAFDVVAVAGSSMAPALHAGDRLVVESLTYRRRAPRPGEIVLAVDPREPARELIKRAYPDHAGRLRLLGDAEAASTDSRVFGDLAATEVRWRAAFRYWPPGRIGALA